MRVIEQSFEIMNEPDGNTILIKIEAAGRTCYKSEDKITDGSAAKFVAGIIRRGHESVLEHEIITVRIITDRGVTHELVRHRIASYSQESTRYCNYMHSKFDSELSFIEPAFWNSGSPSDTLNKEIWLEQMRLAESCYNKLIAGGATPEQARTVLPNSLKTEIVVTMNLREWRHFFKLRTAEAAHPQIRLLARNILDEFRKRIPVVFDNIAS